MNPWRSFKKALTARLAAVRTQSERPVKHPGRLLAGAGLIILLLLVFLPLGSKPVPSVPLSKVLSQIQSGQVRRVRLNDTTDDLIATLKNGHVEQSGYPLGYGTHLVERYGSKVSFTTTPVQVSSLLDRLIPSVVLILLLVGAMFVLLRLAMPGGGRTKMATALGAGQIPPTRFSDVAGLDEVVDELNEVVQFLHHPEVFTAAGAKIPHGFLLVGPPGTGKTLLARAVAGEAGVPFYALSGSDFLDTYVGVGAARVKRIFTNARKSGRAIIFIDELDAVGRTRNTNMPNAATDESDRTLNALLVEMDGFAQSQVIVLGATNRPEVLDSALLRMGRFDRKITFTSPDRAGREKILYLATRDIPLGDDVDLGAISRRTASLTGADLHFLANEAALTAARESLRIVSQSHFTKAVEVTFLGRARTSLEVSDTERRIVAWHEAGHAVAASVLPNADRPVSVSTIPRGGAGGVTWMENDDRHFVTRSRALASLTVALAGRAGEMVLVEDDFTSGAANDLRVAANLAKRMVTEWGMGPQGLFYSEDERWDRDEKVASAVNGLITNALAEARSLLVEHSQFHNALANELLENDTVSGERLAEMTETYRDGTGSRTSSGT